jgi:hypothetical protein
MNVDRSEYERTHCLLPILDAIIYLLFAMHQATEVHVFPGFGCLLEYRLSYGF